MTLRSWLSRVTSRPTQYSPGLDAVVVNYRTPQDLEAFVAALAASEPALAIRLVLANVAPLQGDLAAAERCLAHRRAGLEIVHLPFEDNVGYARACNAGLLGGTHDVVALFTVGTNAKPRIRGFRQPDTGQFDDVVEGVVTVAGSAYFMRRSLWQELTDCPTYRRIAPQAEGAFLPTQLFYEETWCSYHAGAHGYANVFYGPAVMEHTWHGSVEANEASYTDLMTASREVFRQACDAHGIERD